MEGLSKTTKTYFTNTYLFELKANIQKIIPAEENKDEFQIIVDQTIFHPQGGGQPKDNGVISSADGAITFEVSDLKETDGIISHVGKYTSTTQFEAGAEVDLKIDEKFRRTNARIHSAGHLLDMAMNRAGKTELKPGKGYHFEEGPYVEYIGVVAEKDRAPLCEELNKHCADIIAEAKANNTEVFRKMCSYDEANEQLAGAGGVPSYVAAGSELRVLKLTPEDLGCPCGGTHVHAVPEIGRIEVTAMKKKKTNTQVKYQVVFESAGEPAKPAATQKKADKKADKKAGKPAKEQKAKAPAPAKAKNTGPPPADLPLQYNTRSAELIARLNRVEKALKKNDFMAGSQPTSLDVEALEELKGDEAQISALNHPRVFGWYCFVSKFSDAKKAQLPKVEAPAAAAPKKAAAAADDDDMDLFGDDDEDDGAAAAAAAAAKKKAADKKKAKKVVIAKSSVMFEVKPLDDTTDLDVLYKRIGEDIQMDGLVWGLDMKKVPVAFGIFKLIVACVVEDDKVSVDDVVDKIEAFDDMVQSVEIAAFNKI